MRSTAVRTGGRTEACGEMSAGFVVTREYRVLPCAKAQRLLNAHQLAEATRHPDEPKARAAARNGMRDEIATLEARLVELRRRMRNTR